LWIKNLKFFGVASPSRKICIYHISCGAPFGKKLGWKDKPLRKAARRTFGIINVGRSEMLN
jgi:hypothetical protein